MPAQISDDLASSYLNSLNRPISVSVMNKLGQFPMYQELGYNGQLGFLKQDFHGLQEWYTHMGMYSSVHAILLSAWAVIKALAPKNPFIALKLFVSSSMGTVGNAFRQIAGFSKIFAATIQDAKSPSGLVKKISSYSSQVGSV
jgi:hypothetical protein